VNLCRAQGCGADFGSVTLFDAHRVGRHEYTFSEGFELDPPREDGRRCLDPDEMFAKGWALNDRSRWVDPVRSERVRERFETPSNPQTVDAGAPEGRLTGSGAP
jgi:hypothetical protein